MKQMQTETVPIAAAAVPGERTAPWAMAGLALAMLLSSLGTSIVNVALPTLANTFDAPFATVQWLVIAYLLTSTAVIVGVGRLGDLFGARRLLLGGLMLFAFASAACGAAPSLPVLIGARALQGIAAAVLMAMTVVMVRATVASERTGAAMGLLGTMSAVGTALGPSLGGALVASCGWRAVFFANVPLALLALALAARHLPRDPARTGTARERFDAAGTALLAATLTAFALATTVREGSAGVRAALLLLALGGALAFALVERRLATPLIPLSMLSEAGLGAALATNGLVSTVMMATLVVGPFYLTRSLGLDAGHAGLAMSVGPLVSALTGVPAGRLVDRIGPQRMTSIGLIGVGIGTALLALSAGHGSVLGYVLPLAFLTSSYALFQAANNTAVLADVPPQRRGLVSGLLSLSRNLGLMTGAAALGAVFAAACGAVDAADAPPEVVGRAMQITFATGAALVGTAFGGHLLRRVRSRSRSRS